LFYVGRVAVGGGSVAWVFVRFTVLLGRVRGGGGLVDLSGGVVDGGARSSYRRAGLLCGRFLVCFGCG